MKHEDVVSDSQGEIVARLIRALMHQVRGDLSVITNDLVYISSLIDPHEVKRTRERCAQISHLLGRIGVLSQRSLKRNVAVRELISLLHLPVTVPFSCSSAVEVDSELVDHGVTLLAQLIGGTYSAAIDSHDGGASFEVRMRGSTPRTLGGSYRSASSFAAHELGERAVIDGCIIDLIIRDHNWQLCFEQEDQYPLVRLSVPVGS